MESMAYINHDSAKPGSTYQVFGDLRISQRQPLAHRGVDDRYNVSNTSFKSVLFRFELQFIKFYFWKKVGFFWWFFLTEVKKKLFLENL